MTSMLYLLRALKSDAQGLVSASEVIMKMRSRGLCCVDDANDAMVSTGAPLTLLRTWICGRVLPDTRGRRAVLRSDVDGVKALPSRSLRETVRSSCHRFPTSERTVHLPHSWSSIPDGPTLTAPVIAWDTPRMTTLPKPSTRRRVRVVCRVTERRRFATE